MADAALQAAAGLLRTALFADPAAEAYRDSLPREAPAQLLGWRQDAGLAPAGLDPPAVPAVRAAGAFARV